MQIVAWCHSKQNWQKRAKNCNSSKMIFFHFGRFRSLLGQLIIWTFETFCSSKWHRNDHSITSKTNLACSPAVYQCLDVDPSVSWPKVPFRSGCDCFRPTFQFEAKGVEHPFESLDQHPGSTPDAKFCEFQSKLQFCSRASARRSPGPCWRCSASWSGGRWWRPSWSGPEVDIRSTRSRMYPHQAPCSGGSGAVCSGSEIQQDSSSLNNVEKRAEYDWRSTPQPSCLSKRQCWARKIHC